MIEKKINKYLTEGNEIEFIGFDNLRDALDNDDALKARVERELDRYEKQLERIHKELVRKIPEIERMLVDKLDADPSDISEDLDEYISLEYRYISAIGHY